MSSPPRDHDDLEPTQPSGSNKRKADELQAEPAAKRRASKACLSCRSRKVRCDVTSGGTPCTNCRLDNINCQLVASSRGRHRASTGASIGAAERIQRSNTVAEDFPVSLTFEGSSRESIHGQKHPAQAEGGIISPRSSIASPEDTPSGHYSRTSADKQVQGLPSYIKPLPARLKPIDIEYLTKKGALTLPDDDLQVELFRKYLQYIHPFMPILDVAGFLSPIARGDGSRPVSLIVFQAVMFASSVFMDIDYPIARGYRDRRSVRKEFFERVRLLYDQDFEPDRIAVLQALLLMTFWYDKSEDEKETWYWTGAALSLAQVLGMHRNPDHLDISPPIKRLRKRIWWSCFVRDRLLAIGIRRPARIRAEQFDVPMMTLEDCEMEPLEDNVLRYLGPLALSDDIQTKQSIAQCFIELSQLCIHIGDILFTQYSILGNPARGPEENITMMVMPIRSANQMQEMTRCDRDLEDWLQDLNPACRYRSRQKNEQNECHLVLHLHQALLHMIYLTATVVLHRPQALRASVNMPDSEVTQRQSREKVTNAAARITEVVYDLHQGNQLRFASTSSIPALLSATLIHLVDIRYSGEEVRYTSIGRFYQCWQALQCLRDMYASADHAVWFLEGVIQKTNIYIPMLNLAPSSGNTRSRSRPGRPRFRTGSTSVPTDAQGHEPMDLLATADNTLMTPLSFENAPTNGMYLTPGALNPLSQSEINNSGTTDTQAEWTGIDAEEDLLQILINFNANPNNYFTTASVG